MIRVMVMAAVIAATPVVAQENVPVLGPAEAIAAADAARDGQRGRFAITVVNTGKLRQGTFLNSTADYRAADVLTIRLAPAVAGALSKRYGAPAEVYLKGKRVTVDGIVRRVPIVNSQYGRARSFNRWTHEVYVPMLAQVVAVE